MLFPPAGEYARWFARAGFDGRASRARSRPTGTATARVPYALAVSGVKPAPGPSPAALPPTRRRSRRAGRAALRRALRARLRRGRRVRARSPPCCALRAGARWPPRRRGRTARRGPRRRASLWRFARPHTIIGTALSVAGLYVIAVAERRRAPARRDLLATLIAGLAVNVAIVGVNQITDVEIDRVNKPFLPIAAGDLHARPREAHRRRLHGAARWRWRSRRARARRSRSPPALAVGALYSLPPPRLKRFPVAASLCISGVRSLVVNLGVYWHFAGTASPRRCGRCACSCCRSASRSRCSRTCRTSRATAASASARSRSASGPSAVFRHRPGRARARLRRA